MGTLAFTKENIEIGFKVTEIHPIDENIFGEDECLSSFVTDREAVEKEIDHQPVSEPIPSSSRNTKENSRNDQTVSQSRTNNE
jgi:hypothetical protein